MMFKLPQEIEVQDRSLNNLLKYAIMPIDKPMGPTSHEVSSWVKKLFPFVKRSGHSGTLDPRATGLLPVGINKATKVIRYLQLAPKEYVCLMKLHKPVDEDKIRKAVEYFTGELYQLPPVRAAVARKLRTRRVYKNNILEIDGKYVLFKSLVESGTYIRKLCHHIGLYLGVGAHMQELIRTKVANIDEKHKLQDIVDAWKYYESTGKDKEFRKYIWPVEKALSHLKKVWLTDEAASTVCKGAQLAAPGIVAMDNFEKGEIIQMLKRNGQMIGIGKAIKDAKEIIDLKKGIVVKTERIIA